MKNENVTIIGRGVKASNRRFARVSACVVTLRDIAKEEIFSEENIWVKRPGTGEIKAVHYHDLLGRKATIDISKNTQLKWNHAKT